VVGDGRIIIAHGLPNEVDGTNEATSQDVMVLFEFQVL
jgi:hypothetical protein